MLLGSSSFACCFALQLRLEIQVSCGSPTRLILHSSYWLCMHVLLACLVCAKTVIMCIMYHCGIAPDCTQCVLTGVPVPNAQALWLSNRMQPAETAAWHRHWQLDTLLTPSAAVVMLSVLHAQRMHTSLPLVNRYRLQLLVGTLSDWCHGNQGFCFLHMRITCFARLLGLSSSFCACLSTCVRKWHPNMRCTTAQHAPTTAYSVEACVRTQSKQHQTHHTSAPKSHSSIPPALHQTHCTYRST